MPSLVTMNSHHETDGRGATYDRGRSSFVSGASTNRSRSLENRPQYGGGSSRNDSVNQQQNQQQEHLPQPQHYMLQMSKLEPTYHDIEMIDAGYRRALTRSLSPERPFAYRTPYDQPHIYQQQKMLQQEEVQSSRQRKTTGNSFFSRAKLNNTRQEKPTDSNIMFSDAFDSGSVLTGWSEQELLKKASVLEKKKGKKYGKKKEGKKNEGRILNMPLSVLKRNNTNTTEASKRYVREVDEPPPTEKRRSLIARYGLVRKNSKPLMNSTSSHRQMSRRMIPSVSQSSEDQSSTQESSTSGDQQSFDIRDSIETKTGFPILSTSSTTDAKVTGEDQQEYQHRRSEEINRRGFIDDGDSQVLPAPSREIQTHPILSNYSEDSLQVSIDSRESQSDYRSKVIEHQGYMEEKGKALYFGSHLPTANVNGNFHDHVHTKEKINPVSGFLKKYPNHHSGANDTFEHGGQIDSSPTSVTESDAYEGYPSHLPKPTPHVRRNPPSPSTTKPKSILRNSPRLKTFKTDHPANNSFTSESSQRGRTRVIFEESLRKTTVLQDPPSDHSDENLGISESIIVNTPSVQVRNLYSMTEHISLAPKDQPMEPSALRCPPIASKKSTSTDSFTPILMTRSMSSEQPFDVAVANRLRQQEHIATLQKSPQPRIMSTISSPPPRRGDFTSADGLELSPIRKTKDEFPQQSLQDDINLQNMSSDEWQEQNREDWGDDEEVYEEYGDEDYDDDGNHDSFIIVVATVVIQTAVRRFLAILALENMLEECDDVQVLDAEDQLGAFPRVCRSSHGPISETRHVALSGVPTLERKVELIANQDKEFSAMTYKMYILAAVKIQAFYRGWWVRDCYHVDHYCAKLIQRIIRGYLCRLNYHFDLYRIVLLQSFFRMNLGKEHAAQKISFAIHIQAVIRGFLLRKAISAFDAEPIFDERVEPMCKDDYEDDYQYDYQEHFDGVSQDEFEEYIAATIIETRWRSYDCQMNYLHTMADILVAQSVVRRWIATKRYAYLQLRRLTLSNSDNGMAMEHEDEIVPSMKSKARIHDHQYQDLPIVDAEQIGTRGIMNAWKQREAANMESFGTVASFWKQKAQANNKPPASPTCY